MNKLLALFCFLLTSCSMSRSKLDIFRDEQSVKLQTSSVYNQAELNFFASYYEPTENDLISLRQAWTEHSGSFPESKDYLLLEREVHNTGQKIVLICLFSTDYEIANLQDKSLGWTFSPQPQKIIELSEYDQVLRTLMPIRNPWARYFLVTVPSFEWNKTDKAFVANKTGKIEFQKSH